MAVYIGNSSYEAYQSFIGSNDGRAIFLGSDHVWPNYVIKAHPFSYSGKYGKENVTVGDTILGDPAGFQVNVRLSLHESSWWHLLPVRMTYTGSLSSAYIENDKYGSCTVNSGYIDTVVKKSPIIGSEYDTYFQTIIPANDGSVSSSGELRIISYTNEFGQVCQLNPSILIYKYGQDVNIMYYIRYGWVSYNDINSMATVPWIYNSSAKDTSGEKIDYVTSLPTIDYNITIATMGLYVSFGVSFDGGNTIYFNYPNSSLPKDNQSSGTDSLVPTGIAEYLDITTTNSAFEVSNITQLSNTNFFRVDVSTSANEPTEGNTNVNYMITDLKITSGSSSSPASYTNGSTSIATFKVGNASGSSARSTGFNVHLKYPSGSKYYKYNF